jgi:hypothetical protein
VRAGLRAVLTCPSGCRATARLQVSRRDARRLGSGRTLARRVLAIGAGRAATVVLRAPARTTRALSRGGSLRATLAVRAVGASGAVHEVERRVVLR